MSAIVIKARIQLFLKDNKIPYDEIWDKQGKPPALAYVDDRGVMCRPFDVPGDFDRAVQTVRELANR